MTYQYPPAIKERKPRPAVTIAALTAAVIAAVLFIVAVAPLTPFGRARIVGALDGRDLGPAGVLAVEGFGGNPWSRMRVARLTLSDDAGVWLEARDVELAWRPLALVTRTMSISRLSVSRVEVFRPPEEREDPPPSTGGDDASGWSVRLDELLLPAIVFDDAFAPGGATLAVDGSARLGGSASTLVFNAQRLDQEGDVVAVDARWAAGRADVSFAFEAAPGGPLAVLLDMPDDLLEAHGEASFADGRGALDAVATINGESVAEAEAHMEGEAWSLEAVARLGRIAPLAALTERVGEELRLDAAIAAEREGRRALTATASARAFEVEADGEVGAGDFAPLGPLNVRARIADVAALMGGEAPLAMGAARFDGTVALSPVLSVEGEAGLADVAGEGFAFADIAGPVRVVFDDGIAAQADLTGAVSEAPASFAALVGAAPRASGRVVVDGDTNAIVIETASLALAAGDIAAAGRLEPDGALRLDAELSAPELGRILADATGSARLNAVVSRAGLDAPIEAVLAGAGEQVNWPDETLQRLTGTAPVLDAELTFDGDRLAIRTARLAGAGLELTADGVVGPNADDMVRASLAVAGPLEAGPLSLDGAVAAALEARALMAEPSLRAQADVQRVLVGDGAVENASLRLELAFADGRVAGPVRFDADGDYGVLAAAAALDVGDGGFAARDIEISSEALAASGDLAFAADGVMEGELRAQASSERGGLRLTLSRVDDRQAVAGALELAGLRLTDSALLRHARLGFDGGFDAIALTLEADAELPEDARLEGDGRLSQAEDGTWRLTLDPSLELGDLTFTASEAWTAAFGPAGARLAADLRASDGASVRLAYARAQGGAASLDLAAERFPVAAIAILTNGPAVSGAFEAEARLAGESVLTGPARARVERVRPTTGDIDIALDAELDGAFGDDGFTATASARSSGFFASAEASLPIALGAWPPSLAARADDDISGRIEASGPIASVWSVLGSPDRVVEGALTMQASLSGPLEAPVFTGAAQLTDGRYADSATGIEIVDLEASARFADGRAQLERLVGHDLDGGSLSATGAFDFDDGGAALNATLERLTVADRVDARAVMSGSVGVARAHEGLSLEAALDIDEAELAPLQRGAAGAPALDVVEINRPESLAPPPRRVTPPDIALNASVRADRRVFFRARGLDTEWSFDVDITGEAVEPLFEGEARLLRGTLELAGARFELDEAVVTLNGPLESGRLNLVARRAGADIVAIARVSGPIAQPRITLESTPSYPQDEILARVLFGRSAADLTPIEAAQLASAVTGLARGGGLDVLGALRRGLGVDRLTVRAGAEDGPVISGGRYLSDDVYLELGATAAGGPEAEIQWRLRPQLELASRLDGGETAVSLRWRWDY